MNLVVTLQCVDQPGIVHALTSAILECKGNIIENQQFTDPTTRTFIMRTLFETELEVIDAENILRTETLQFSPVLEIRPEIQKRKALILVTKDSHCLRDILFLLELGELPIEIPLVMSNHEELRSLVESHGITFTSMVGIGKSAQEEAIKNEIKNLDIDFVVLARYMQILGGEFCDSMPGKMINIHHSFLPGFKGAKPYHQAHARGVKVIGATAHFVTSDLDEGPIIEQDVAHVTHASTPENLVSLGRDIERRVLSKAVKLYAENRIFLVGDRTIVFA
jgi:formyltetrahydrofolate deformylase